MPRYDQDEHINNITLILIIRSDIINPRSVLLQMCTITNVIKPSPLIRFYFSCKQQNSLGSIFDMKLTIIFYQCKKLIRSIYSIPITQSCQSRFFAKIGGIGNGMIGNILMKINFIPGPHTAIHKALNRRHP
jgi:hypothetical protein